ncbi:unknown protein [Seminavis robusta]|uniref:Uncharacterized protein n=1 Tax=Seminavis robusta TaxID=568900 RepID=A0A9N8HPP2_9STRA|nr:unknown protein [Seminavis robusta]|eukprot:Sro917_g219900.1 n/a (99) ;mRNA; f:21230-21526
MRNPGGDDMSSMTKATVSSGGVGNSRTQHKTKQEWIFPVLAVILSAVVVAVIVGATMNIDSGNVGTVEGSAGEEMALSTTEAPSVFVSVLQQTPEALQ